MTMTTDPKLIANRRNAKSSSGPVSAAGKAASSQNARKHGLRSSAPSDRDEAAIMVIMSALMGDRPERRPEARAAAEARLYLDRVRSAKAMILGAARVHAQDGALPDGTGRGSDLEASAVLGGRQGGLERWSIADSGRTNPSRPRDPHDPAPMSVNWCRSPVIARCATDYSIWRRSCRQERPVSRLPVV